MNLVFHQLKKDIYRTRFLLGLWFAMIVAQCSIIGINAKPGDLVLSTALPVLTMVLGMVSSLLILLLIPLVVHQEPLVGTTAFWFTRPLSRATLLREKSLYVLLLVILPILTKIVVFLAHGVTFHDVLLAIPQLVIEECSWIFMVAVLAVLTPNFARFAILGIVIAVVWYLIAVVIQMLIMLNNPFYALSMLGSMASCRMLTSSLIMILFGVAVIVFQYLGRNSRLVITLVIAGAFLSLAAHFLWPWDFLKGSAHLAQDPNFNEAPIAAKFAGGITSSDQVALRGGNPLKEIQCDVIFTDVPKGYFVRVSSVKSVLKTTDGKNIPTQTAQSALNFLQNSDQAAIEQALGGVPVFGTENYDRSTSLFALSNEVCSRYSTTPLNYSGELKCTASKYVISAELPLVKGANVRNGSEHLLINEVLNQPKGVEIIADIQKVKLLFGTHTDEGTVADIFQQNAIYLLLNKKLHQAMMRKADPSFNPMQFMNMGGILSNQPLHLTFGEDDRFSGMNSYAPQIDKKWLEDAVLIKLDPVQVASFYRKVDASGIKLDGKFQFPYRPKQTGTADKSALGKISLPPNPTRDQVQDYITQILIASRGNNSMSVRDPQIAMLEKVGSQNVDLLVKEASNNKNFYLTKAIDALAQPENKQQIIDACSSNPDLMDTVVKHGWQADAKPLLLTVLDNPKQYRPASWIAGIVSFKDPSTYDGLKSYFSENGDPRILSEFQKLPDFDLAGTIDQAWKKAQTATRPQYFNLLQPAAQYGEPGVLDVAVKILNGKDEYMKPSVRTVFETYTPVPGRVRSSASKSPMEPEPNRDTEIVAWYEANKTNLNYDPQTQRFVLGAIGSQPPPTPLSSASPAGLSAGSTNPVNSVQSTNQPQPIVMPTIYMMRELGRQAATGDTGAIDRIETIRLSIYQNISYKDSVHMKENWTLMKAAFDQLALPIKGNDASDPAFKSLLYAAGIPGLKGFTVDSFGIAAAHGNTTSLDILLHYSDHGILLSDAVGGLKYPAESGDPEAVAFLIKVIDDESHNPLWDMASSGLENAANQGNPEAQRVRAKYAEYKKQTSHQTKETPHPSPGASLSPTPIVSLAKAETVSTVKPESTPIQPISTNNPAGAASSAPTQGATK